jgi:hypothetical protein
MEIGGWKTDSMFRRYAIVSNADIKTGIEQLEQSRSQNSHDFSHDSHETSDVTARVEAGKVN